jgi:hypothetical protein
MALEKYGYSAETFVTNTYYITTKFDRKFIFQNHRLSFILVNILHIDLLYIFFNYQCLYIYFNGGVLSSSKIIWRLEPILLRLAGIKTIVMPYGSDIQIFNRTPNLYLRHCAFQDYPQHKLRRRRMDKNLSLWTTNASHVISGCDWVDYMYHWDTLMVSHFAIDMDIYTNIDTNKNRDNSNSLRILHAPNHRNLKGTQYIIDAVLDLRNEGLDVELILAERKSNQEILKLIKNVDLIVDQLVIGWYAMFAIEGMLARKPVICFLRQDLIDLYKVTGLISSNDPPIINSNPLSFKNDLREIVRDKRILKEYGQRGFDYVKKYHSLEAVGREFDRINKVIGICPANIN